VLLWSANCAEWVAAFLGCALCGAIAVPVDDAASPDFGATHRRAGANQAGVVSAGAGVGFRWDSDGTVPTVDPADLSALVAGRSAQRFRPCEIQSSDTLEIVFTSGTTAEPRGVVLTHANVVGNLVPIETEIKKYLKYERLVHPIRFSEPAAAEPRLRPIPGDVSGLRCSAERSCSKHLQPKGSDGDDSSRTRFPCWWRCRA